MPEIVIDDVWLERLAWMGPTGLIVLTFLLRTVRQFIVKHRKPKPDPTPPDPVDTPVVSLGVQQASTAISSVEDFYAARRAVVRHDGVPASVQAALFLAVEEGRPQLVTLYDPADVKAGGSVCTVEDFPYDDPRRRPTAEHPAAGEPGEVVIVDTRPLPNVWHDGPLPKPAAELFDARKERRREAIEQGVIGSPVRSVQQLIDAHDAYISRVRRQAEIDFELLKATVREDAERLAREKFVPARAEQFEKDSTETGNPVKKLIEEFVTTVGEAAVAQLTERYNSPPSLPLLEQLTGQRMQVGGMWSFAETDQEK